jgi:hypothetical protein
MKKFIIYGCITIMFLLLPFLSACHSAANVSTSPLPKTILAVPEIPDIARLVPTVDWQSSGQTSEAADDIVTVPGGAAYRANVHQAGVPDKWPSILLTDILLRNGYHDLSVHYRSYIESKAGETRNNIIETSIDISNTGAPLVNHELTLYSMSVPQGIILGMFDGGGIPGTDKMVLTIQISPGITPGEYSFDIGIVFDDMYYGALPCTIKVTK